METLPCFSMDTLKSPCSLRKAVEGRRTLLLAGAPSPSCLHREFQSTHSPMALAACWPLAHPFVHTCRQPPCVIQDFSPPEKFKTLSSQNSASVYLLETFLPVRHGVINIATDEDQGRRHQAHVELQTKTCLSEHC